MPPTASALNHTRHVIYPRHVLLYLRSETVGLDGFRLPVVSPMAAEVSSPAGSSGTTECSSGKESERSSVPPCKGGTWRQFVKRVASSSSEEAVRMHREMLEAGFRADVYSFSAVMTACQRNNDCEQVIRCFHEMKCQGLVPDLLAYNTVIMAYSNKGMCEEVFTLFHEMKAAGVAPDSRTYTFVIAACSKVDGGQGLAETIFEELKSNGVEATKSTYKSMMTLFGAQTEPGWHSCHVAAKRDNISAQERSPPRRECSDKYVVSNEQWIIMPSSISKPLQSHSSKTGDTYGMQGFGDTQGFATQGLVARKAFQKGDTRNPRLLLLEMWDRGMKPDVKTYNAALFTCARVLQLMMAEDIFADMKAAGVYPDIQSYNAMISACAKVSALERAEKYFAEMQPRFVPETITYNGLISAAGRSNDCVKAEKFFHSMKKAGLVPDCATFNALLAAVAKNSLERSEQLLQEMLSRNIELTLVSHTTLISAASKSRTPERAEDFFQMMLLNGLHPNAVTYTSMISAAVRYSIVRALELYHEMIEMRLEPTSKIFKTLLEATVDAYIGRIYAADLIAKKVEMIIRRMRDSCMEIERNFKVLLFETFVRHWNVTSLLFPDFVSVPFSEVYPESKQRRAIPYFKTVVHTTLS